MITSITWDEIYPIWRDHLWPDRHSPIKSNSAMVYLGGHDGRNMTTTPTFWGWIEDGKIVGVNSGHSNVDDSYRSRGLWVHPQFRDNGIAQNLLRNTIDHARILNHTFIWSYPRFSSWNTYSSVGFIRISEWESSELNINAYCQKILQ